MKYPFKSIIDKFKNERDLTISKGMKELSNINEYDFAKIHNISLPIDESIWKFDPRIKVTPEYKSNMDIQMGNNWERLSAQLGIVAKDFRK